MAERQPHVLIVGAGPVGLTAALELKRRGIHPRIIDKSSGPAAQSRALGVNPRTLELLSPSGVSAALLEIGNPLARTYVVENGATIITLRIERLKHRHPFMLIVPQSETEQLLLKTLSNLGVDVEWNTELMELTFAGTNVTAVIATADDVEYSLPDYLIGADVIGSGKLTQAAHRI